jgi:cell wall-associated NlpC family hydrolase
MTNGIAQQHRRALAIEYAKSFLGVPYKWGGDDPIAGYDCSGFVVEILQAVGILPHATDFTAEKLRAKFKDRTVLSGRPGCLAFWLDAKGRALHVMMMLDDEHAIGEAGGGSATGTPEDAARANAFVKIRPVWYRGGLLVIADPFMEVG